jgi:hypothetical protein
MTTDEALEFLRSHQPLPPTRVISEKDLKQFDAVRKFFAAHPDDRCVPLFLNAFGEGDGHGIYQLVEDTILAHSEQVVVPSLLRALHSPHGSVREWAAEIAANYARPELVSPLARLLNTGGVDTRMASVAALEAIGTPEAQRELENAIDLDIEEGVKDAIRKALGK